MALFYCPPQRSVRCIGMSSFVILYFRTKIFASLGGVRCKEVLVNGSSIVCKFPLFINLMGQFLKQKWPVFYFGILQGGIAAEPLRFLNSSVLLPRKHRSLSQFVSFCEITP